MTGYYFFVLLLRRSQLTSPFSAYFAVLGEVNPIHINARHIKDKNEKRYEVVDIRLDQEAFAH